VAVPSPASDLDRAYEFLLEADMVGTRREPFRWGTAVFAPEVPLRHDSNYLLVTRFAPDLDAPGLAGEAERLQGAAGLAYRFVMVRDGAGAERLVPGFTALGWTTTRGVVMAQRRPPDRGGDLSRAVETDASVLHAVREAQIRTYPWGTPEVARQLMASRELLPYPPRDYAVFEGGRPVSWVYCASDGRVAQVEALATDPAFRGRGHARALVLRAAEDARRAGADLVFLVADAADWPKDLYRRLGFDEIGLYAKFLRAPA
jgi:ribosomal protein S18 acetylase RimI-like enzyme